MSLNFYLHTFLFNIFSVFIALYLHNYHRILASSIYNIGAKMENITQQLPLLNAGGPLQLYLFNYCLAALLSILDHY